MIQHTKKKKQVHHPQQTQTAAQTKATDKIKTLEQVGHTTNVQQTKPTEKDKTTEKSKQPEPNKSAQKSEEIKPVEEAKPIWKSKSVEKAKAEEMAEPTPVKATNPEDMSITQQNEPVEENELAEQIEHRIDDASFQLILQLQLDDLEALKARDKGKQREGEPSDIDVALGLAQGDLQTAMTQQHDRQMCISIAKAVSTDAAAIRRGPIDQLLSQSLDRTVAARPQADPAPRRGNRDEHTGLDAELIERLEALNDFSEGVVASCGGEHAAFATDEWSAAYPHESDNESIVYEYPPGWLDKCECCHDSFSPSIMATAPCSHKYCRACLNDLFRSASVDESLFPPRCCKRPIPVDTNLLSTETVDLFRAKEEEFSTPNRTYCHRPQCSAFLPAHCIQGNLAACGKCKFKTCVACKGAPHVKGECPKDAATQEVLRMAKEQGWQQCKSCKRIVELNTGCYHMSTSPEQPPVSIPTARGGNDHGSDRVTACLCKAEFCYLCGRKWKTCHCAQWDERRLFNRAEQIVNRDARYAQLGVMERAQMVNRAVAGLRQNHECRHYDWHFVRGRHECDECHDVLPEFIFTCTRCDIRACKRCRYNRL